MEERRNMSKHKALKEMCIRDSWTATENDGAVLKSDAEGNFKVTGLDNGTYTLVETKAPAGYNLPANGFSVTLEATTKNNQTWNGTASTALTDLVVKVDQTNGTGNVDTGLGRCV